MVPSTTVCASPKAAQRATAATTEEEEEEEEEGEGPAPDRDTALTTDALMSTSLCCSQDRSSR
jgi:hypothetical protein